MRRDETKLPLPTETIAQALQAGVRDAGVPYGEIADRVQDAWVALLTKIDRLAGVSEDLLPAYIRKIGRSSAIDGRRKRRALKRGGSSKTYSLDEVSGLAVLKRSPEELVILRDLTRSAIRTGSGRSTRTRQVLTLLFLGLSPAETAERLGITRSGVDSVLSRARKRWELARAACDLTPRIAGASGRSAP